MKTFFYLIKAEALMLFGELKTYFLNYVFYNIGLIILFTGLMYNYGSSISLLLALVLWHATTSSTSYLSSLIYEEAMMGTLEQIFLTKTKIQIIMASKIFVNLLFTLIKSIILLAISSLFFLNKLNFEFSFIEILFIIVIYIFTILTFYFLGEIFGGLSLYYKRISSVLSVFTNILLLFSGVFSSIDLNNVMFYITPLPSSIKLISMVTNENYENFLPVFIVFILLVCIYIISGITIFNLYVKKAKKDGKLNQY